MKSLNSIFKCITILLVVVISACSGSKNDYFDYNQLEFRDVGNTSIAFFEGQRYTGEAESRLKNGNLFFRYGFEKGIKHGPYVTYYSNGNKQKEGTYNKGKQHGEFIEYYNSGKIRYHYNWDNDKKTGDWKSYYEDGAKWTLRQFKNDRLHGKLYVWDETGRLGKEHTYNNGAQIEKFNHFENFKENK